MTSRKLDQLGVQPVTRDPRGPVGFSIRSSLVMTEVQLTAGNSAKGNGSQSEEEACGRRRATAIVLAFIECPTKITSSSHSPRAVHTMSA